MNQDRNNIDSLLEHGLMKFNNSASTCSLAQTLEFVAKAIDLMNAKDFDFLMREDHFDFVLADIRGNEFLRAVRTGDSSIYSGNASTFVIWGKKEVFKPIMNDVNPMPVKLVMKA